MKIGDRVKWKSREGLTIKMDREALLKVADRPIELPLLAKDQMWKHVSELQETRRKPIPWMYLRLSASRAIAIARSGLLADAALRADGLAFLLMERAWPRPQDENGQ